VQKQTFCLLSPAYIITAQFDSYKTLQVGKFQQIIATFIGGFVVAFVKGWLLSLVMLATIPPVVLAGVVVSKMLSKISNKCQTSSGEAGNVVEQTLGAITTVSSMHSVTE
jgi:ATP-binding cassette subfamily B (MDR/TAP) protein 1